ncbi:MAG: plasmid pRiA4b ORF-3 family protein [Clostridia bacterium]|nr:plasmid pRiA4b ORF-3 family protein [Clostridia bacterium]
MAAQPVYQFYAELKDFKPKIWRRFQVAGDITVARLGYIVMTMYEMTASHLLAIEHERPFLTPSGRQSKRMERIGRYYIPDEDGEWLDMGGKDATKTKLSQLNLDLPTHLNVWYDFGDDWRVTVKLEEIKDGSDMSEKELPRVLEGKGFGIVEDCGGVWGLEELAEAFKEKAGSSYEQFRDWLGTDDFDIKAFDMDDMNFRLKKLPSIYAKIYEHKAYPTKKDIDLIERNYKKG